MAAIFLSSAQPEGESSRLSEWVSQFFAGVFFFDFGAMSAGQQSLLVDAVHPFVRKAAHFTAYALLGLSVFFSVHLLYDRLRMRLKAVAALSVCALYACFDEIHQLFVPGRDGNFIDVLIDVSGSLCGIVAGLLAVAFAFWVRQQNDAKRQ